MKRAFVQTTSFNGHETPSQRKNVFIIVGILIGKIYYRPTVDRLSPNTHHILPIVSDFILEVADVDSFVESMKKYGAGSPWRTMQNISKPVDY